MDRVQKVPGTFDSEGVGIEFMPSRECGVEGHFLESLYPFQIVAPFGGTINEKRHFSVAQRHKFDQSLDKAQEC
jgi:hypothetical protein